MSTPKPLSTTVPDAPVFESGLALPVPEADAVLGEWRTRNDPSAALGAGAHVTLLVPFKPRAAITPAVLDELASFFAARPCLDLEFAGLCAFPTALYLAPEPAAPVETLIRDLMARYPEIEPYGGGIEDVVPHLTVAYREPQLAEELIPLTYLFCSEVGPRLPFRATVRSADLSVAEPDGSLTSIATLPFAA